MRGKILFLSLFLVTLILLSLNIISAEIMLSQPSSVYNLGDSLQVKATIKPSQDSSGFFELNLKCGNESKNFHREPSNLKTNEEKKIETNLLLINSFLGNVKGDCNIEAVFLSEQEQSQKFKISDKIDVSLSMRNVSIEPGKEIEVKGSAKKENGKEVEGFLELSVENTDIKITRTVKQGSFVSSFTFPENAKSGNSALIARVYEKFQGEITNSGEARINFDIKQIPSKVEVATSKQSIKPGENLSFASIIYDQANEKFSGEISVKIYNSYDAIFYQKILKSGEEDELFLESNATSGYWKIDASALELKAQRLFYVEELEKVKFEIKDNILIITNIGNVVYRKAVQISIGDVTEVKNLDLDVGESKKLRLAAPEGKYQIAVTDGDTELETADVSLTGRVIGIEDIKEKASLITKYPIVWLFLIAVLGLAILLLIKKTGKESSRVYTPGKFEELKISEREIKRKDNIKKGNVLEGQIFLGKAEHSLVLHGRKENVGIITIRLKDLYKLKKSSPEAINNIHKIIIENKGVVYETSDFLIGIFSSITTKTFNNQMLAVKTSRQINEILREHNRKIKEKTDYGISLNSGDLILRKEQDKVKFTTVGNTLNLAKKISELARGEVLLSQNMQEKLMSEVKTEKEVRDGLSVYHIKNIIERDKHKEFISDFLRRLGKEGK